MSTPKPTSEQLMHAVIAFARKQLAAGMAADKVRDLLVAKGLTAAAASRVMAKLASPRPHGGAQASATADDGKPAPTRPQNADAGSALRGFGVQGRFLRLPANKGKCTLPNVCVVCGEDRPAESVVREEKTHSYGLGTRAASLWAITISLLMFPSFLAVRGLQWMGPVAGLLMFGALLFFLSRRNKLTLVYTACTTDAAARARRNTVATVIAVALGLLVVACYTVMLSSLGDLKSSSLASRLGAAAGMSWPWFLLLNWFRRRFNGMLRIATTGKTHAFVDGCSAPFLESMGRLGAPTLVQPTVMSLTPRPGYPVARFWWTFFLLGGGLASIPMLRSATGAAAQTRAVVSIAHAAGSRPGKYQDLPGLRVWVPAEWQLTSEEVEDPTKFLTHRLAPPDDALLIEVAAIPKAVIQDFALDDANGLRLVAANLKQRIMNGYKASEPTGTTLNGEPAQRIDVSGFIQTPEKGLAAVPITFVVLQQKRNDYVYRVYLTLHSDWVRILGPSRLSEILEWVKPAEDSHEVGVDVSQQ